jgi:phage N-6-adenine-methyltransferase
MSLVAFKAANHPQQTGKRGPRPEIDDRATPPELFDWLHERFKFTIDVAALPHNAKLPRFYTPEQDGLAQSWAGERVWCNPPYSDIWPWVAHANNEWALENCPECIVMLVPANRTEQRWWQWGVEPFRDGRIAGYGLRTEFLNGRQRFIAHDKDGIEANERPPFGVCLLIWEKP